MLCLKTLRYTSVKSNSEPIALIRAFPGASSENNRTFSRLSGDLRKTYKHDDCSKKKNSMFTTERSELPDLLETNRPDAEVKVLWQF